MTVAVEGPLGADVAHTPKHLPTDGSPLDLARSYQEPRQDDDHNGIGEAEHVADHAGGFFSPQTHCRN